MAELETRRMGRTEMRPKALGLGAAWLVRCPESETIETIQRALELGINYFDTYPGHEEGRWAKALKGHRDEIYLQAKIGTHPDRSKDFSAEGARWSVENSLKDLGTDYLDALLIHDPPDIEDPLGPGRALDELLKMKEEGLIRAIGLGVRQHEFHKRAIETGHIDLVLTHSDYSLLGQSVAQTTLPLAQKHDVGIMLATVLAGCLTGIEPDRESKPQAHAMWKWCGDRGFTVRDFAIQFGLAAPIDGIVIVGPANRQQLEEDYASATVDIPPEIWSDFKNEFGVGID